MNKRTDKDNSSIKLFLGIPTGLLLVSLFISIYSQPKSISKSINPFIEQLPEEYVNLLTEEVGGINISFCNTIDNELQRQLIVFKETSNSQKKGSTDFIIKIYPSNSNTNKNLLPFQIIKKRNAKLYNYKNKTLAIYSFNIPFINIDKINIGEKKVNSDSNLWEKTLKTPFKTIGNTNLPTQNSYKGKLIQPNIYKPELNVVLKKNNFTVMPHNYFVRNDSLFEVIKDIDKYLEESKSTLLIVKNPIKFWDALSNKNPINKLYQVQGTKKVKVDELVRKVHNDDILFEELFNIQELSKFNAILKLYTSECLSETNYFVFENQTQQLKPFFYHSKCIGLVSRYIKKAIVKNDLFTKTYIKELNNISQQNLYENYIQDNEALKNEVYLINQYYPKKIYDSDYTKINQLKIKKSLNPSRAFIAELISVNKQKMKLSVFNISYYPIEIKELSFQKNKTITAFTPKTILSGKKDTIEIKLPRSFENLFVSKKNKTTGFLLHKNINEIYLGYTISGVNQLNYSNIAPYQPKEKVPADLFRNNSNLSLHDNIEVNKITKTITFNSSEVEITKPLILPKGYKFVLKPGLNINILNGGKIISYSPIFAIGNKKNRIRIYSSDKKGQGVLVMSEGQASKLEFVDFEYLTNPSHGLWNITGAVTFYESPVSLKNVRIKNNRCEDALNIIRTTFVMTYCRFSNIQSDAFDGDFVSGVIRGSVFTNIGNDAIDVSGSKIKIVDTKINLVNDKGLSAGEDSEMYVEKVTIKDSEIGIAGKDLSTIEAKNVIIINTKLGFTAFQKKSEFGASSIVVTGLKMKNVETNYLIENASSLFVDGKKIETTQNVKDRMYGIEFGTSSSETRNKQY